MFEKYIEQKEQCLAEQINLTADYVNLFEMIFNPKIEQAYKTYFSAEVDWWLYEEQISRTANLRFNFDDPKLNSFLKQMDELYKKNARFSTVSLPLVISSAVKSRLNYLCRPRTALKWFVYRWDQTKTYHEIIKRLNYLDDYKYLIDGFVDYVRRNQLIKTHDDLINMSLFDKIINEIDNSMMAELSPEGLVQLMGSLFSFFNSDADHKDTAKIPVEAVIIFFDDKNMMSISTKLESLFRSGELLLISKKYLLGFIYKSLYDADNMYGGGDDNITNLTKEIEQVNHNYMNIANSLKENIALNQDISIEESWEDAEIQAEIPDEIQLVDDSYLPTNIEVQEDSQLDFSNLNLASFSANMSNNFADNYDEPSTEDSTVAEFVDDIEHDILGSVPLSADTDTLEVESQEIMNSGSIDVNTIDSLEDNSAFDAADTDEASQILKIANAASNQNKGLKSLLDSLMYEIK